MTAIAKIRPNLVADGARRFWCRIIRINGQRYAKIDNRLKPVVYDLNRGVWIAGNLSIDPKLARYL